LNFPLPVSYQFSRSYGIDTCPIVMADPENLLGIAVGIALLSSVETEIFVMPYPLPV